MNCICSNSGSVVAVRLKNKRNIIVGVLAGTCGIRNATAAIATLSGGALALARLGSLPQPLRSAFYSRVICCLVSLSLHATGKLNARGASKRQTQRRLGIETHAAPI